MKVRQGILCLLILAILLPPWYLSDRHSGRALANESLESLIPAPQGQRSTDWIATFSDEFNGSALDRTIWSSDYGNGNGGELQEYVDDDSHGNYLVQNGILQIVARAEAYQGRNYTSGIITTRHSYSQKYGYFEMRAKMPDGQGFWPAFWMMPSPTGWPPEIDVMEYIGYDPNTVNMTVHYSDPFASDGSYFTGPNFSAGWHVFGVYWQEDAIIWYVDGVERKRFTDAAKIPEMPMFLLVNFAVGGKWPGAPDATTVFPAQFEIDYLRAWTRAVPKPDYTNPNLIFLPVQSR